MHDAGNEISPMDAKEILRRGLNAADLVIHTYLQDLPVSYWNQRPHPDCRDLNWQFGHLILSEASMIAESLSEDTVLDEQFAQLYAKRDRQEGDRQGDDLYAPDRLWQLYARQRAMSLRLLNGLEASQLSDPANERIRAYCPTIADAFVMTSSHWLMHSGQWVILRRMAGLPIVL